VRKRREDAMRPLRSVMAAWAVTACSGVPMAAVRLAAGEIRYVVLANALFDAPLARSVTEITARE